MGVCVAESSGMHHNKQMSGLYEGFMTGSAVPQVFLLASKHAQAQHGNLSSVNPKRDGKMEMNRKGAACFLHYIIVKAQVSQH